MLNKNNILKKIKDMKPAQTAIEGGIQLAEVFNSGLKDMSSILYKNKKQILTVNVMSFAQQFISKIPSSDLTWPLHVSKCWLQNVTPNFGVFVNPFNPLLGEASFSCINLPIIFLQLSINLLKVNQTMPLQEESQNAFAEAIINSYSKIQLLANFLDNEGILIPMTSTVS